MALAETVVSSFFGGSPAPTLEIGLLRGDRELPAATPGYARQSLGRGDWQITSAQASATVRFGPFPRGAQTTGALLLVAGEPVEQMAFNGELLLLPGMELEFALEIRVI